MLKKEIWAIKRLGFSCLRVMISIRVQGLRIEHRVLALVAPLRGKSFNLSPFLYSRNKRRRNESSSKQKKVIVLLSEQKADTRGEEGNFSND